MRLVAAVTAVLALALPATAQLPKVLLLGDAACRAYAPEVKQSLAGVAEVVAPDDGGDVTAATKALARWREAKPAVVHIHFAAAADAELAALATAVRKVTPHVVVAAPPNAAAVLNPLGVPVHDIARAGDRVADAVADVVRRQLALANPVKLKSPASGPAAVAAYRKAEAEQDARVPAAFKSLTVPAFPVPETTAEWATRRPDVLAKVAATLGDFPPRPRTPNARLVSAEIRAGFRLEKLRLDNGLDGEMSAMILIPDGRTKPAPAVLWLHSSSFDHTQLLVPDTNGGPEPLGVAFAKRGWVVFAPDAAWYGDRAGGGPAGDAEFTANQQASQHKLHLWFGRTLWGGFVRDDRIALDYLCARPEVDAARIGATGISMGSTRSWWLAALDERIKVVVGVACLTRAENLIRHGQLRQHGVYYFASGLLKHFDTEAVVALIAPRPALFLTGELDAGSPADGIRVIEAKAGGVYAATGAADKFRSVRYPDVGHTYTPAMRAEMLAWFDRWLK